MNKFHSIRRITKKDECELCCIKIIDLSVNLGGHQSLENINLHIHCGELTVLTGPNGAGKSTLFKAMLKELPYTGSVIFLDANNKKTGRPLIGHVPQKLSFDPQTPATVMDLFSTNLSNVPVWFSHEKKIREIALGLLNQVKAGHLIDRKIGLLSGGELQRVLLAMSLYPSPNLLLLDEPDAGVDKDGLALFYQIVSELRHQFHLSIILITHALPLVLPFADRVIVLDKKILSNEKGMAP
jgi:zinc transport system ATP-binding protein